MVHDRVLTLAGASVFSPTFLTLPLLSLVLPFVAFFFLFVFFFFPFLFVFLLLFVVYSDKFEYIACCISTCTDSRI